MGVCVFAREEKQLFLQIFSRHTVKSPLIDEFLNVIREELKTDERIISIDKDKQEELLHTCWVFAHGLSTLIAIDFFKDSSDEFIERSLKNGPARLFYEYLSKYSKNNNIISKELLHFVIALLYYKDKKNCYKINLYMRNRLKTKNICGIIKALFK